ncbi:hypothetical protein [Rhodospirillaceae bacterium SYSU D60014]|uniref:hypothetical protein n=1 Tax=Virgifigura deserti TaxID=2268457 RepID=UPI000E6695F4
MKRLGLSNPVTGGLALGCVVLGGGAVHEILSPAFAPSAATTGTVQNDGLWIEDPRRWSMAPATEFAVITERPLFTPGRRPPQDPIEREDAGQSVEALALMLSAVVASPDRRLALVEQTDGVMLLLSEGDEVDGWLLAEIHAEHVIFHSGRYVQRFYLKDIPVKSSPVESPIGTLDAVEADVSADVPTNAAEGKSEMLSERAEKGREEVFP